ncbi:MAG: hypothetical protein ABIH84_00540 [bacterium]
MKFFIGTLEDNLSFFVQVYLLRKSGWGHSNLIGYPYGIDVNAYPNNQPVYHLTTLLLGRIIEPVLAYNLIIAFTMFLTILISFRFFNCFLKSRTVSFFYAVLLTFSPYMLFHLRSHLDLIQLWTLMLYLLTLIKAKKTKDFIFAGLILSLTILTSNYLGFAGLIFTFFFFAGELVFNSGPFKAKLGQIAKNLISLLLPLAAVALIFISPYLISNYLITEKVNESSQTINVASVERGLGEFFTFSSRPWYTFMPPISNPFYGNWSANFLSVLQNSWGYWLTFNYFPAEHAAAFLGNTNLTLALVGLIYIIKSKNIDHKKRNLLYKLLLAAVGVYILTLPPYFTINLIKIYTPSYLLYVVFPMFRSLVRLNIIILPIMLIFSGYGIISILRRWKYPYNRVAILLLLLISFSEFIVPIKITAVPETPAVYSYIKNETGNEARIAIYPYSKTKQASFWIKDFDRPIINAFNTDNPAYDFKVELFTNSFNTTEGLNKLRELGGTHLIYFPHADEAKQLSFFDEQLEHTYVNYDETALDDSKPTMLNRFLVIDNIGSTKINTGIVYTLTD